MKKCKAPDPDIETERWREKNYDPAFTFQNQNEFVIIELHS